MYAIRSYYEGSVLLFHPGPFVRIQNILDKVPGDPVFPFQGLFLKFRGGRDLQPAVLFQDGCPAEPVVDSYNFV